jgi:hypothetical protein
LVLLIGHRLTPRLVAVRAALRRPPGDAAPPSTPSQATRIPALLEITRAG